MNKNLVQLAAGLLALGVFTISASAQYTIVNVIPNVFSAEQAQDAEPSIAVNPINPSQTIVASFSRPYTPLIPADPIFASSDPSRTWTLLDWIPHGDQAFDWSAGGPVYGTFLAFPNSSPDDISVGKSTGSVAFTPSVVSIFNSPNTDQPWIVVQRRGLSDRIYDGYNDSTANVAMNKQSARLLFSLDGGATAYQNVTLEQANPFIQDSPAIRTAVLGDRVYSVFQRYTGSANGRPRGTALGADMQAQIVVVRDDNGGLGPLGTGVNQFSALGANGVSITNINIPWRGTLLGGVQKIGSSISVAVDPRNPDALYVAYTQLEGPVGGFVPYVHAAYSTDGGKTWQHAYRAPFASALPALAVAASGTVGLLYTDVNTNYLETRFVQGSSGFNPILSADAGGDILCLFPNNGNPPPGSPNFYIGDFEDIQAVGNKFYGTFSASGEPDGSHFPQGVYFQRNAVIGGVLTNNFLLNTNTKGRLVGLIPTTAPAITNKWLQVPDTSNNGLDVRAVLPFVLADDFLCTASGPITRITLWGSWLSNNVAAAPTFALRLYSNVPSTNGMPSRPGAKLWEKFFEAPNEYATNLYTNNVSEKFFDPSIAGTNGILGSDNAIWQYTFNITTNDAFVQTSGNIYWLAVNARDINETNVFGWKTCPTNWNDASVYVTALPADGSTNWTPIVRPGTTNVVDLAFAIGAGGPAMSTNVAPSIDPYYFSTAVKTNQNIAWSQPPGYQVYPLDPQNRGADRESDLDADSPPSLNVIADDFLYKGAQVRRVRWWGSYLNGQDYPIEDGYLLSFFSDNSTNAAGYSSPTNLLATYIAPIQTVRVCNSGYIGCDGLPIYQYEVDLKDTCTNYNAGTNGNPAGFLGSSNQVYWLSIAAYAGFSLDTNTCRLTNNASSRPLNIHFWGWHTSPIHSNDFSVKGQLGTNSNPWPYSSWVSNSPVCTTQEVDQAFVLYNDLGTVAPPITFDTNSFPNMKWLQRPNLSTFGMDVLASDGSPSQIVADDFRCTQSGALIQFHVWGSWLNDQFDPNAKFRLGVWEDTPATTNSLSHPGGPPWLKTFTNGPANTPFSYSVSVEASGINCERFYDPAHPAFAGMDTTIYRYDFYVPTNSAFYQVSNSVYWLSVNAITTNVFGWKTAMTNDHNLDAAVWSSVNAPATNGWLSLFYPSNHLYSPAPVDLSFAVCSVFVPPPPPPVTNIIIVGKWLQIPDTSPNGLDVRATLPKILADDFLCNTSGPITKIEIWGSWRFDYVDATPKFCLGLWSDVLATNGLPSHPGVQLWGQCFDHGQYYYEAPYPPGGEQFYDPDLGIGPNAIIGWDSNIWHYTFPVALTNAFRQTNGTVYWLSVTATVSDTNYYLFGWKTCPTNWNDNAVFSDLDGFGNLNNPWEELIRPGTTNSLDLSFAVSTTRITTNTPPPPPPPYIPTNYLVQWSQTPSYLRTPIPAGEDRASDFTWGTLGPWSVVADDWQADGRPILGLRWWGSYLNGYSTNIVDGFVLSFFSDGHPSGGDDDNNTNLIDSGDADAVGQPIQLLGTYIVPSSAVKIIDSGKVGTDGERIFQYEASLSDGCLQNAEPNSFPGSFQTVSGTVYWVSIQAEAGLQVYHTTDFYGAPACGSMATANQPVNDFWGWHTAPCQQLSPSVGGLFDNFGPDWQYYDWFGNDFYPGEIDQAFETLVDSTIAPPAPTSTSLTGLTWLQRPDLTPEGLAMLTTLGQNVTEVADDFVTTNGLPLTSIKIWGSWLNDVIDPNAVFLLSIWSNAPAAIQPGSIPLWQAYFTNIFSYQVFPETPTVCGEPFFDPSTNAAVGEDSQVYRYEFFEPAAQAFTPVSGGVYWLSVSAIYTTNSFGWKTAAPYDHFKANAVWYDSPNWDVLLYPANHPYAGRATNTLDMAFALTAGCVSIALPPPNPTSTLQDDGTVLISWPDTGDCFYVLQATPQLNPVTWTAVPLTTPTSLVVSPTNSAMFFRLYKP